jgi:CDP-glycerol glycerophosphotransferase
MAHSKQGIGFLQNLMLNRLLKYKRKNERMELYKMSYGFVDVLISIIFLYIPAKIVQKKDRKPIWLFCERGEDAKDNAFFLFEYIRKHKPEINAFYLISKDSINSIDYKKLQNCGNVIPLGGILHRKMFFASEVLICTHLIGGMLPWSMRLYYKLNFLKFMKKKFAFIQHGVIYNDLSSKLHKKNNPADIFIAGARPEYDYLLETLGYSEAELKYTGLARYDFLHNVKLKKQILVMPTWRRYLSNLNTVSIRNFKKTKYFIYYQDLLRNEQLCNFLQERNITLLFFLHPQMQVYSHAFQGNSQNIIIAKQDEFDISQTIRESRLLITDYSSVFFDFAYMQKPMLFYQFDEEEFFSKHTRAGYFTHRRNGFGPVFSNTDDVVAYITKRTNNNFVMEDKYRKRAEKFFPLHDTNNRERIFQEIWKINN